MSIELQDEEAILRVYIRSEWHPEEFADFFRMLQDLYFILALIDEEIIEGHEIGRFSRIDRRVIRNIAERQGISPMRVGQIEFASPGHTDLIGLGKILEQINKFIFGVTDRFLDREQRRLENEKREIENKSATSDQVFLENQRIEVNRRQQEMHEVGLQRKRIENQERIEKLRVQQLTTLDKELAFEERVSKRLRQSNLSSDEQGQIVQWIGSRSRVIESLVGSAKVVGSLETERKK